MESSWQYSTVHNSACKVEFRTEVKGLRTEIRIGDFYRSESFRSVAKVIENGTLWGSDYARIWLPNSDAVVRGPAPDLSSLSPQHSALSLIK